ncbi:hypothetical protein ACJRO7_026587 [Eucalyptus globulus]|uniref:TIR domain-containing protein n=1 Tax=Eucalyptus globulus TaxID=34317 RepID=A0ABD3JTD1_EUCGL
MFYSSKIYIPIFSKKYACSPPCLDSLTLMVEHTSRSGRKKKILPVFYNVGWSDVKLETSLYRGVLDTHKQSFGDEKVERCKKALVEAGKVKGWEISSYESERELITAIVGEILFKAITEHNYMFEDLSTGDDPMFCYRTSELEDSQESKIMELLELEVNEVRVVGIHGRDGIGKTALAKILYDKISLDFDACSFLVDIEETTHQPGGVQYLQTKLIFDILKREYEVASAFKGVRFLKEIFRNMKVLIVLDDLERGSLLKEFVGAKLDWFGCGSRIIVTSKERSVLQGFLDRGLACTYDVSIMDDNRAFNFFWQHAATGKSDKLHSYVKSAIEIVKAAKGFPLLVKVFGSFLKYKRLEEWMEFEDHIQQFQEDYQKILSIIYDALHQKQKQTFLDIACFPPDVDSQIALRMFPDIIASIPLHYIRSCHFQSEIEILRRMALIEMEENKLGMHSLLRCLAKKQTALTLKWQAMRSCCTAFLSLGRANIGRKFVDALLNVQWLHWQGCPGDAVSIHLEKNETLVILDLSWSKVTEFFGGCKGIKMEHLRVLNFTGCADLLVTPSFSCCPNLEILILERCSRLVHLDPSINDLKLLVTLNLKLCSELSMLPAEMDGMKALKDLLIDGTSVRELLASIGKLFQLQILSATNCFSLVRVPGFVCDFRISLSSIGDLWRLRRLSLRDCRGLRKLPEFIGIKGYLLEELDISGTGISKLPDSIKNLRISKVLKVDSCFLRKFPHEIGELVSLEEVHASCCRSLEGAISNLHRLRELRLSGTRIYSLPSEIHFMSSLQTLDLLRCDFLKELPTLPPNLSNLYLNPDLKQKLLEASKFRRWWHLLQ